MAEHRCRDEKYLDWIRQQPCCICGDNVHVEAHHPRVGLLNADPGMAQKASDKWALPLCGRHHRELHGMAEREFWAGYGIDQFALAINYRMPDDG